MMGMDLAGWPGLVWINNVGFKDEMEALKE